MPEISSRTSLYCVIGTPVEHSLSPLIQNALFQRYEIDAVYLAFEIGLNELKEFFQAMRILKIKGCNITLPYKVQALNYLDEIDKSSKIAGCVNTVINRKGRLYGYNTDVFGIEMALKKLGSRIKEEKFLVLGAGGASRAVLYFLAENNPGKIFLSNRTYSKTLNLKNLILSNYPTIEIQTLPLELTKIKNVISEVDIIINATSVGIKGEDFSVISPDIIKRRHKVFDLTYSKKGTVLVKACKQRGIKAIDGIPMLIYQAMKSFQIWTGIFPDYKFLERKLKRYLR